MPSTPAAPPPASWLAPLGLLVAATVWGLIWYPYRLLLDAGVSGSVSSLLTYALGLPPLLWLLWRGGLLDLGWQCRAQRGWLLAVAVAAGWTNLSYVLAVIHGEVVRVMLLFYLAPLWTMIFAWFILRERPGPWGWVVTALALGGAWVMLAAEAGVPMPANAAEWLALSSGIGFALTNVLTRRIRQVPIQTRAFWVFAGVTVMALLFIGAEGLSGAAPALPRLEPQHWAWVIGVTLFLLLATFSVQYGLAHTRAIPAVVILLSELVVAAVASYYLAGEVMGTAEWLGGAMIMAATLFTLRLRPHD